MKTKYKAEKYQQMAEQIFKMNTIEKKTYKEIEKKLSLSVGAAFEIMKEFKKRNGFSGTLTFYHWLKYTGEMEKIVEDYTNKKETTISLAEKYGVCDRSIADWLRKEGVEIRSVGYESRTNQNIFSNVSTEIQAYTIGLITADGNLAKDNSSISISLIQTDRIVLDKINQELLQESGHFILTHQERKEKAVLKLSFNGKKLQQELANHNITPNKSKTIPELSALIPEHLYHHYIRGLFDGDGVCSKCNGKIRIGFCSGSEQFLLSYYNFIINKLDLNKNKPFKTSENCFQCSWSSRKDITAFYNYIYKDATIFLPRKKEKIERYLANTEIT